MKSDFVNYQEKTLNPLNGYLALLIWAVVVAGSTAMIVLGHMYSLPALFAIGYVIIPVYCVGLGGFTVVSPNEALVLVLFGKYKGTIRRKGFSITILSAPNSTPQREVRVRVATLYRLKP